MRKSDVSGRACKIHRFACIDLFLSTNATRAELEVEVLYFIMDLKQLGSMFIGI